MKERRLRAPVRLDLLLAALAALAAASSCTETPSRTPPAAAGDSPDFGDAFWRHWGDGRAELAGYDLTFPRYGQLRPGVAVAVFVTETFSSSLRVKADPGKHPASDEFPVMKLNLIESFPTGIYDYNLLTSAFVALAGAGGLPPGTPAKVSFSAQEWCGHVYSQVLFDRDAVRHVLHSYFDGEADRTDELPHPPGGMAEDALLVWARGLAAPVLAPGETREVDVLGSLKFARLGHGGVAWQKAKLAREAVTTTVTVPAGSFEAEVRTVALAGDDRDGGRTWTFTTEVAEPHRILRWECTTGEKGELLASDRLKYWEMNGDGFRSALARLGLAPRPPRTR